MQNHVDESVANEWQNGTYRCVKCDQDLFSSRNKMPANHPWVQFEEAITTDAIDLNEDEYGLWGIYCADCKAQIGSIYCADSSPEMESSEDGQRQCIIESDSIVFTCDGNSGDRADGNLPAPFQWQPMLVHVDQEEEELPLEISAEPEVGPVVPKVVESPILDFNQQQQSKAALVRESSLPSPKPQFERSKKITAPTSFMEKITSHLPIALSICFTVSVVTYVGYRLRLSRKKSG